MHYWTLPAQSTRHFSSCNFGGVMILRCIKSRGLKSRSGSKGSVTVAKWSNLHRTTSSILSTSSSASWSSVIIRALSNTRSNDLTTGFDSAPDGAAREDVIELERGIFNKFKRNDVIGGYKKINSIKSRLLEKEKSVMKQSVDDVIYGDYKYNLVNDELGYAKIYRRRFKEHENDSDAERGAKEVKEVKKGILERGGSNFYSSVGLLVVDMASLSRYYSPRGGVELLGMKPCHEDPNVIAFMTRTIEFPYSPKLWLTFLDTRVCLEVRADGSSLSDLNNHFLHDFEWAPAHPSNYNPDDISDGKRSINSVYRMYLIYRDTQSDRTDIVCEFALDKSSDMFRNKVKRLLSTTTTSSPPSSNLSVSSSCSPSEVTSSVAGVTLYTKIDVSKDDITLLHRETAEAYHLNLSTSKDKTATFIHSQSKTCTEVFLIDSTSRNDSNNNNDNTNTTTTTTTTNNNNNSSRNSTTSSSGNKSRSASIGARSRLVKLFPKEDGIRTFVDVVSDSLYITSNRYAATGDLELFKCGYTYGPFSSYIKSNSRTNSSSISSSDNGGAIGCVFCERDRIWPLKQQDEHDPDIVNRSKRSYTSSSSSTTENLDGDRFVLSEFDAMDLGVVVYGSRSGKAYVDVVRHESLDSTASQGGERITSQIREIVGSDVFDIFPSINSDINSKSVDISVSNPLLPEARLQIDLLSGDVKLLSLIKAKWNVPAVESDSSLFSLNKIKGALGIGVDKSDIRGFCKIDRHYVTSSKDGDVRIPLTVVTPMALSPRALSTNDSSSKSKSSKPLLLVGYGAYGSSLSLAYLSEHHELLERGWTIAFAHTRGGGELGAYWYRAGKLDEKWNSVYDYIDCAKYLRCAEEVGDIETLVGKGCSAGGILLGVSALQYGHLFNAIVMRSPFLNVLGAMQDPTLPLTEHEYDEWGRVVDHRGNEDQHVVDYIRSYSPIDLMNKKVDLLAETNNSYRKLRYYYPEIMITLGLQDTRVDPYESFIFASGFRRLQASMRSDDGKFSSNKSKINDKDENKKEVKDEHKSFCLVRVWPDGGHDGPDSLEDQAEMKAEEIVFLELGHGRRKETKAARELYP